MEIKKRSLEIDFAICFIWIITIICSRHSCDGIGLLLSLIIALWRITFSFLIYKKEKRALIPLLGIWVGLFLASFTFGIYGVEEMVKYPIYHIFFLNNYIIYYSFIITLYLFLWIYPLIIYLIQLKRKELTKTTLTCTDIVGGVLWTDKSMRKYCIIMIIGVFTLLIGLIMDAKLCLFIIVMSPILTYLIICKQYCIKNSKNWVIPIAMLIFFFAQGYSGITHIVMLIISFIIILFIGNIIYKQTNKTIISIITILYIGIILPSMAIGYNQYTCINYARTDIYPMHPFHGIFFIKQSHNTKTLYGLRDRYGILVKPT